MNKVSNRSIAVRGQLQSAVEAGYVLVPYHQADVTHIEPWLPTTANYDPNDELISEPPDGRVVGTRDIDVAVFAAITGYMGPRLVAPLGSARIMQRVDRFAGEVPTVSSIYSIATISFAGKIALRDNEATGDIPTLVYSAQATQFEERPGLFPFMAISSIAIEGGVEVSSDVLGVNPYELPAVEAIDWTGQAAGFEGFVQKSQP